MAVIESKQAGFSLKDAIAQTLFYMMAPDSEQPTFGLVTNGSHFIFIKLLGGELPQYGFSSEFSLDRPDNELYSVLRILKRFLVIIYFLLTTTPTKIGRRAIFINLSN